jgi:spore coat polysaccharide biosynthesis protein SpsF
MKVAATLACRAESSRLYAKPLQNVGGRPILTNLIEQLRRVRLIDEIVLAISAGASRHIFIDYAETNRLPYVVGDQKDVLGRLIQAADYVGADIIVRDTTENPYLYWENLDDLIGLHIESGNDLTVTERLPLGVGAEIISVKALKRAHSEGEDRHRSEFCSLFIAENPHIFKIQRVPAPKHLERPDYRLTVDNPEDLIVVRRLWDELHEDGPVTVDRIVAYLNAHPELAEFNRTEGTLYIWK